MKKSLFACILACLLAMGAGAQIILSAGAAAYVGQTGLMPGGALGFEIAWPGFFGDNRNELTCMTVGLEFPSVTTAHSGQPEGGFVFPLVFKERYILQAGFDWNVGIGTGLAIIPTDEQDYFGNWYTSSLFGVPIFAETGLQWWSNSPFLVSSALRAGALFSDNGTYPFVGLSVQLGFFLNTGGSSPDTGTGDASD